MINSIICSLDILHKLFKFLMDREIFQSEKLLLSLSVGLVMAHNGSHHLVGSIVPEIQNNFQAED